MSLRIVGDVHGKYLQYAKIARKAKKEGLKTVQLGDMGFSYGHFKHFGLDPEDHSFFGGNHDNYDIYSYSPNALGDYGFVNMGDVEFFFVRGAFSVDKFRRSAGIDWWLNEELTEEEFYEAREVYLQIRPSVMITHDAPDTMRDFMLDNGFVNSIAGDKKIFTRTGRQLDLMFQACQPKLWIFGHWHFSCDHKIEGTRFICLSELERFDI